MTAPTVVPPDITPTPVRTVAPDELLIAEVESAFDDIRVGVVFDETDHVYVYLAPVGVHVESIVVVPPSWYRPDPHTATVVTLDPPPYAGPVKRVLAVLS